MDSRHVPAIKASPSRRRYWQIGALLVLLAIYAATLAWASRRLETDVQRSIHPVPAVLSADHADR